MSELLSEFLRATLPSLVGVVVLVALIYIFYGGFLAKSYAKVLNEKRMASGLAAMTDAEMRMATQVFRSVSTNILLVVFIALAVALVVGYFI